MQSTSLLELQNEVLENNRQLDLIFNTLPQSMALVNPRFEILRVNNNFLNLYGVKNEDVIGKKCHDACFKRDRVCEGCLVEKVLISRKTEKKIKSFPNGEVCEMTARPVLNEQGEVTHILDIRTNITELVEKEKELRRIRFAMDQSTDEFWLFNHRWETVFVSNSASKNLGYNMNELINAPIGKINVLPRIENVTDLWERLRKEKNIRIESVHYKKDGTTYPCEMNLNFFADSEEYVYAVVRNITQKKRRENELIEAREKAEKGSKLKSTFLANMSHEIRTPLNAIIGFSNMVMEEELDEAVKSELKHEIVANSDYLLSLIGDVMELSQLETGNKTVLFKSINLCDFFDSLYREQNILCPSRLSLHVEAELLPENTSIVTDPALLYQILKRLITNAFKFSSSGLVDVHCRYLTKKSSWEFSVSDTGIGIAPEHLDDIFEPFFQVNPMVQGVGLGLSICRSLAELLNTRIRVSSIPGKGSTFHFRLREEGSPQQ